MLNDPFLLRQCEHLAARAVREAPAGLAGQIDRIYRLMLGRPPSAEEARLLSDYAKAHGLAAACRVVFEQQRVRVCRLRPGVLWSLRPLGVWRGV